MDEALNIAKLDEATTRYDAEFKLVPGLTWLPWVGHNFSERPLHQRLLIVGESHYFHGETSEERQVNREKWLKYPQYTRDVVSESLVNYEWTTKTLDTIPKLLFRSSSTEIDRHRLWGDSAYYNIVQRMMDYLQDERPERPTWDDYVAGWKVFARVVSVIQPSHCLFIGVTAANSFNHWIASQDFFSGNVSWTQKVGGTWARTGILEVAGTTTQLIFVKHLGLPLNWGMWNDYMRTQHPEFMQWLQAESYTVNQKTDCSSD